MAAHRNFKKMGFGFRRPWQPHESHHFKIEVGRGAVDFERRMREVGDQQAQVDRLTLELSSGYRDFKALAVGCERRRDSVDGRAEKSKLDLTRAHRQHAGYLRFASRLRVAIEREGAADRSGGGYVGGIDHQREPALGLHLMEVDDEAV